MTPAAPSAEEALADDWQVAYLRLLHDYEKLRRLYLHARAAIDNDLWAHEQKRCPF
jgi:hypothetical protein